MQIVIDIPEEEYQNYLKMRPSYPEGVFCYIKAIQNGTPLPKGHGRIIDINKMEYLKAIHDAKYGEISWNEAIKQIKNSAPTIVEADKEDWGNKMIIYIDNGNTVKIFYSIKEKIVKAIETLLKLDDDLIWSETNEGYGVAIIDKTENEEE